MQDRQKISIHALREEGDYRHHGRRSSGAISIHALREEGDLPVKPKRRGDVKFLSTPSARRATKLIPTYSPDIAISIHALREEGDDNRLEYEVVGHGFLSTPSARRATRAAIKQLEADIISIHALREEGDAMAGGSRSSGRNFYPRPPRGGRLGAAAQIGEGKVDFYPRPPRGGRPCALLRAAISFKFLSTPSARRATADMRGTFGRDADFYPRPPRGGRRRLGLLVGDGGEISIHALREEGDRLAESDGCRRALFLSTPSARRATLCFIESRHFL